MVLDKTEEYQGEPKKNPAHSPLKWKMWETEGDGTYLDDEVPTKEPSTETKDNGANENATTESQDEAFFKILARRRKYRWVCRPALQIERSHLLWFQEKLFASHINFTTLDLRNAKTDAWCQEITITATHISCQKTKPEENAGMERMNLIAGIWLKGNPEKEFEEKNVNHFESGKCYHETTRTKDHY